jgi:hypothetical protein
MATSTHLSISVSSLLFFLLCGFETFLPLHPLQSLTAILEQYMASLVPLFNRSSLATSHLHADSTGQYILCFGCIIIGLGCGLIYHWRRRAMTNCDGEVQYLSFVLVKYALSAFLGIYGINKILLWQFPRPEPNLLYMPTGLHSKEMLFWISMGSSQLYNHITGSVEFLACILLLFRRTFGWGAGLCVLIMSHVFILNISFDISVKLLSGWLLVLAIYLYWNYRKNPNLLQQTTCMDGRIHMIMKSVVCFFLCGLIFWPMFQNLLQGQAVTGPNSMKPPLYGAYQLQVAKESYLAASIPLSQFTRVYVHKDHYILLQTLEGETNYYPIYIDTQGTLVIRGGDAFEDQIWKYTRQGDTVELSCTDGTHMLWQAMDWESMPLLYDSIHLFMDSD